ncbi:salt tolerance down-regulator-domain-containing protein [Rhizoctonia solani]|nr:salt tolerance down-regulator-domain-containing protein [Rhizoctonia solani]
MRPAPSVPPPPTPTSTGTNKKKKKKNDEDVDDADQVWAHFPPELRAYVRAEYAKSVRPPSVQGLVQHMEQYGWRARTTTEPPLPVPPSTTSPQPPFPFDAQLFADPAFALALEQLTLAGGPKHPPVDDSQYDQYYSEDDPDDEDAQHPATAPSKKKKKKKKKPVAVPPPPPPPPPMPAPPHPQQPQQRRRTVPPSSRAAGKQPMTFNPAPTPAPAPAPPPPTKPRASPPSSSTTSNTKLWNTNSLEERQRIKEFWLALGESERRELVKVEREAVLKKMKEQQKHSCSCAVCGRKRYVPSLPIYTAANRPTCRPQSTITYTGVEQRSRKNSSGMFLPAVPPLPHSVLVHFPDPSSSMRLGLSSTPNDRYPNPTRTTRIRTITRMTRKRARKRTKRKKKTNPTVFLRPKTRPRRF